MLALDQAILTRYNAAGLPASVGQIYDEQQPEGSVLPYVSYENQSDSRAMGTQASVYQRALVTFTVWHTGKETCEPLCELIETAFKNANNAASNPLAMTDPNGIVSCILTSPYIAKQVSDTIWSGTQTFTILYRRNANIRPAS